MNKTITIENWHLIPWPPQAGNPSSIRGDVATDDPAHPGGTKLHGSDRIVHVRDGLVHTRDGSSYRLGSPSQTFEAEFGPNAGQKVLEALAE
jgi:hypothetical protein